jgi:hypothetical protein
VPELRARILTEYEVGGGLAVQQRRFRDNKHTMARPNHVADSRQDWTASIRATLGTLPDRPLRWVGGRSGRRDRCGREVGDG